MMNDKTRAIHGFIFRRSQEEGSAPTMREIGQEFGINSTNGVRHHLRVLEDAGYIDRTDRKARAIRVLVAPNDATGVERARFGGPRSVPAEARDVHGASRVADRAGSGIPILGRIAAGLPIEAQEDQEGELAIEDLFGNGRDLFALRVQGQSMRDRGILPGDLVVVHKQEHARDGDAVVALLGDDATVKTFRRTPEGVDLVPENPDFEVRHVGPDDDFRVLGVVIGLVRPPGGPRRP
jgi:repressor LexA